MIYLIDASVYVFRAYYSMPPEMTDAAGNPVNAVYGFGRFLVDLLRTATPTHAAVAFDESLTTSFRNDIYPSYKANREPAPPELERQFVYCKRLTRALGLTTLASEQFEADDIIGTLAAMCQRDSRAVCIVTRDKDLAQLLGPDDEFWDYAGGKRYRHPDVAGKFGAHPERIADFLALTGDSVDNIPGVPGIGKKTAEAIFARYASLEEVYANLQDLHELPIRGAKTLARKLTEHEEAAWLARRLTRVRRDVPLDGDLESLRRQSVDAAATDALFDELNIGALLRRQIAAL